MAPRIPQANSHGISAQMLDVLNRQFEQTAHELGLSQRAQTRVREMVQEQQAQQVVQPTATPASRRPRGQRLRETEGYSGLERQAMELCAKQSHQNMVVLSLEKALKAARDELSSVNSAIQELKTRLRNTE